MPAVPLPTKFLFDSSPDTHVPVTPVWHRESPGPAGALQCQPAPGQLNLEPRAPAPAIPGGISHLAGCSVEFLLRANTADARSQALELHISQLRAALGALLSIHSTTQAQVRIHVNTVTTF